MKLDLSAAWDGATRRIGANREVVLVLGGIFFFLPLFSMFLVLFGSGIEFVPEGGEPDPERLSEAINAFLAAYWWALLAVGALQLIGAIALLSVLGAPQRPTVADALRRGLKLFLPLLAAQLLSTLAVQALPTLANLVGGAGGALLSIISLPIAIYLSIKFALISVVTAIEGVSNPINILSRSWALTKGNSLRLLAFFLLLLLAGAVLFMMAALIFGLIFALMGDQGEMIASAAFYAAVITIAYMFGYAVVAAVYRQLSGAAPRVSVPHAGGDDA